MTKTSALAEPDRDITTPLPEELAEPAASTGPRSLATATQHSEASDAGSTGPALGPGTVLRQRYVLERELGRGGMGTVYRALDRNKKDLPPQFRYVAVKVLREEFARRPDALQALRREAHQAQLLSHPGIVNVFDFDHDGDVYFITMELLEGELLSDLIRRIRPGKLQRHAATDILRHLGNAVVYAHSRGVLHMDLKPGNVTITTRGEVRVLDLGLAHPHMTEPWISDDPPPFHAATPTYASCEQLAGAVPDVRDEIFSFACVAYELLSGEHPFGRSSALEARDQGRRPRRIRDLSRREWRTLRQGLAWTRADRPHSLVEFLQGLGLETTTRSGQPAHSLERSRRQPAVPAGGWPPLASASSPLGSMSHGSDWHPTTVATSSLESCVMTSRVRRRAWNCRKQFRQRSTPPRSTPNHAIPCCPAPSWQPRIWFRRTSPRPLR